MNVSEEFKEQLKSGKIVEALTLALGEATELEITTWVSSADSENKTPHLEGPKPGYRMRTKINLVEGDIENEVGTQFIGNGPYTELREFHLEQVQEGRQIVQQNLACLQQIFVVLTSTLSQLPPKLRPRAEGQQTKTLPKSDE